MGFDRKDREFRHPGVSYLEFKQMDMDRVLTAFLARLWHGGLPSRLARSTDLTAQPFVDEFLEHPESFSGFDPETTERWVKTHLLDMVNRGKATEAVAGPRPLHGFTYRFRNSKRSRPYGADEQLYETLFHARGDAGKQALEHLRSFFFAGIDPNTDAVIADAEIDVETQALLHLSTVRKVEDRPDSSKPRKPYPPLCRASADLLVDDVLRLLFHKRFIPRSVLVDYLKTLFAFHLALYHLRLVKLLPNLVWYERPGIRCVRGECGTDLDQAAHGCGYPVGLFLDVAGEPGTRAAELAERSAEVWFGRIPEFVRSAYAIKKLDEFAENQAKLGKLRRPPSGLFSVTDALKLLGSARKADRTNYFDMRIRSIVEDSGGVKGELDPEIGAILRLGLDTFTTYVEIITAHRGPFHRGYIVDALDSLLLKNRPGALITQPRGGNRRFILDSRLLEVLLQVSLLGPGGPMGFHTKAMRVDEFITLLRQRYGLHINQLPDGDGFSSASIADRAALRSNETALATKLREIGFFTDLSDAYLTQTIRPRYTVEDPAEPEGAQ
ncbi:methylation-associated defense system protein MAD7 [Saccharopolyspora rosea]